MARFLLLFLLLNLMAAGFNTLPPVACGEIVPILSIDGGGVKGIIPAVILEYLEAALQKKADDKNARLADYFDVVSGTSTGGIIAAMLTAPDSNNRPMFTASEIIQWYKDESPCIFNQSEINPLYYWGLRPKYNGKCLHDIARKKLAETRLSDALTDVVIPSFDTKLLKPVIFSSFKIEQVPDLNAKLADIAISTSAAPTLLPPYNFTNGDTTFNMIDGAAVADNPALIACSETKQDKENAQLLLLSIGTGAIPSTDVGFGAAEAADWGVLAWKGHATTISGHTSMYNYYLATVFNYHPENYLRIQEYNLSKEFESSDNSSRAYLDGLEGVARELLNETAKRFNVITFLPEDIDNTTNAQELDRLADILHKLKQQRLGKRSSSLEMKKYRKFMKEKAGWIFQ